MTRVYHRTSHSAAEAILAEGFRDGENQIEDQDGEPTGGVELSTPPYDSLNLPADKSEALLAISIPDDELAPWEWGRDDPVYVREFFVPARIVNRYGPPEIIDENDP